MPFQQLFVQPNIEIYLDSDNEWLYVNWIGFQMIQNVKDGCEQMLIFVKEYQCSKVLNDNTFVRGVWAGAAEWGATNWFPRMKMAGVRQFAWVYSPSEFSKMSTDLTISRTSADLLKDDFIRTFDNITEARKWLQQVTKVI